jgi:hypothetical protein
MNRRGFLASLVALIVVPKAAPRPRGTGLTTAQVDGLLKEAYSHPTIEQLQARNPLYIVGRRTGTTTVTFSREDLERVRSGSLARVVREDMDQLVLDVQNARGHW